MSANFCTNCGQRLQQPARYCDNCGAPIENLAPSESSSPARQTLKSGLAGLGLQVPKLFSEPEARETDTRPWGLNLETLKLLLGCSVMNAPLDTGFLIDYNEERKRIKWTPLFFIDSLPGLKVEACAKVTYYILDAEYTYIADESRSALVKGVFEAYEEAQKHPVCNLDITICFKSRNYGQLGEDITGKWVTCVDENEVCDIRTILQFPLSGLIVKQRLRDHEHWVSEVLTHVKDAQLQTVLNQVLASMRSAQKQVPDGFAHHMYCVAYYAHNNKSLDTVLCEEEWEKTEPAGLLARTPQRGLQTLKREALLSGGRPPKSLRAGLWSGAAFSGSVKRL
jgi:hypothetical protein